MRPSKFRLIVILSFCACFSVQADPTPAPAEGAAPLDPPSMTFTGHLELSSRPITLELATRYITEQIERKRADDAVRSPLDSFWKASFWDSPLWTFVPIPMGPQKGVDDPFFTPAYMTVYGRQQDYQMQLSEKAALKIFER